MADGLEKQSRAKLRRGRRMMGKGAVLRWWLLSWLLKNE